MMLSAPRFLAALLAGGLLCVERKSIGQFMLSRPLVAATIIGSILCGWHGWPDSVLMGAVLELYFLTTAPYGASTPPHETIAALFAGALVARLPYWWPPEVMIPVGLALAIPVASLGQIAEASWERWNVTLLRKMDAELTAGRPDAAMLLPWRSLVAPFGAGVIATALGALLNQPLRLFLDPRRTVLAEKWFNLALPIALGVVAGVLLRIGRTRRSFAVTVVAAMIALVAIGAIWGARSIQIMPPD